MSNLICTHCGTEHSGDKLVYRCEHCGGVLKECLIDGKYKFRIRRASNHYSGIQPCEEAKQKKYFHMNWKTSDDPAKVPFYKGETDWWYNEGTNHRVEDGVIVRDMERDGWFVEFNNLDELLAFVNREDEIIIEEDRQYNYSIVIYDDYIE